MIQRFEDEYPETRIPLQASTAPESGGSQHSGDEGNGITSTDANLSSSLQDIENAIDDEETDQYAICLSRTSSMTSLHSRAMTSEEGHVHRLGQNLRRDFLNPSFGEGDSNDESHVAALREKLDRLHGEQSESPFEDKAFEELESTVNELWAAQRQDAESFETFKQSQIAAQINSGLGVTASMPAAADQDTDTTAKSAS